MPELPDVEITRLGISPHITNRTVQDIRVRNPHLRWRVPGRLSNKLIGRRIESVTRRAKYLLLNTCSGTVIIHLGMSGSLRILNLNTPPHPHDHVDFVFSHKCLRFRDPRRFGCILWSQRPLQHRLLKHLGPEPLADDFDGDHLYQTARQRSCAVKNLLMNARVVSGVGNIYANEALFAAGIHPQRAANRVSLERYQVLSVETKRILVGAVNAGGTTLRDFQRADGQPGYFRHSLKIYDREGEPCPRCKNPIRRKVIQARSSFYCPRCQS